MSGSGAARAARLRYAVERAVNAGARAVWQVPQQVAWGERVRARNVSGQRVHRGAPSTQRR